MQKSMTLIQGKIYLVEKAKAVNMVQLQIKIKNFV